MAEQGDRERLELALLLLASREWFLFYLSQESELLNWHQANLKRLAGFEERAKRAYQSSLAQFSVVTAPAGGGTVLMPSVAKTALLERSVGSAYAPAFDRTGQFRKRGLKRIDAADAAGTKRVKDHLRGAEHLAHAAAADEVADELSAAAGRMNRGTARSQSAWALRRDIDQLERRTRHRAGLSGLAASGGSSLSLSLNDAGRAVRVSRGGFTNTMVGTSRHATRQAVYVNARRAGVFGSHWMGVSPFRGGLVGRAPLTPTQWANVARRGRTPGAWAVANPVGTWGMHPGSKSFFMPVLDAGMVSAIVAGLLLLQPDLPKRLEVSTALPLDPSPVSLDGRPLNSLRDLADAVFGRLRADAASVRPGRRPLAQLHTQQLVTAKVALVHTGTVPPLIVLDRGSAAGIGRGLVMNVTAGSSGGGLRGQVVVTSVFRNTSVAVIAWKAQGGGSFRIADFATTTGKRALGA